MTESSSKNERHAEKSQRERRLRFRYAALTLALFVPLIATFAFVRNLYPFAASTMMMGGGDLQAGSTYYILRGETISGETIDLPPIELTNALSGRAWSLVAATVENKNFTVSSPHPGNVILIAAAGSPDKVPPAARLNDLLRSWGAIHNSRLSPTSNRHLRAVTLQAFRWEGDSYRDYERPVQTWRVEL